ncbi:MAG TPA: glycosyltransferase, partial [Acidimicrobiales bacterium]|nr:glycosyltransferase [Acidimicrobiales bacterium]
MVAPLAPTGVPLPVGTRLVAEPRIDDLAPGLVAGGAPWRLLRVSGTARDAIERWRAGAAVAPGEERLARTLTDAGLFFVEADPVDVDVDVVVPVRDDADRLKLVLDSLAGHSVTVVDDGSIDADAVAVAAHDAGARLVRLDQSRGPGAARNAGAAFGSAALVWFVDADIDVGDARAALRGLAAPFADPRVGAVAARVVGPPVRGTRASFESRFSPLDLGPRDALVRPGGAVGYVPAACLLVRREALGSGFDEAMRVGEDVDLVWRLDSAGWLVRHRAGVVVEHPARSTWGAWCRQRVGYGRSAAALRARHGDVAAPLRADRVTA